MVQTIWREWEFGSVQNANFTKPGRLGQISQTNWIVSVRDAGKGFERPSIGLPQGKGRVRNVEIWERNPRDWASLEEEVRRRNEGSVADSIASVNENENEELQSNIPKIWGVGWIPPNALIFPSKLKSKRAKKEFARICSRETRWSSEFCFRMLGFNEV